MSIKLATTTAVLLSLAASPLMAAPIYNIDNYGLVLQEGEKASLTPYFQANASFGKLRSVDGGSLKDGFGKIKPGYDFQLGLNHLGGGYSVDTALYFSDLGKPKSSYSDFERIVDPVTGDITMTGSELNESLSIQSYGLKFAFGFPVTPKSTTSLILGAGFMKAKIKTVENDGSELIKETENLAKEGQISVGLGYRYDFNESISWNINAEHYWLGSETPKVKWLGLNTGLRFYFN